MRRACRRDEQERTAWHAAGRAVRGRARVGAAATRDGARCRCNVSIDCGTGSRTPLFPTSVRNVFHGAPTESHSTLLSTPSRVAVSTVSYVPATRSRTAPRARDSSSFLCWLCCAATATDFTYAWPWWRRAAWCQRSSLSAYTVHTLPRPRARPQRTPASTHTKRRSRREGLRSRKRRRPLRERG